MTVGFAIMAHPSRTEWAEDLGRAVNGPVVYDDGQETTARRREWRTGSRAWRAAADQGRPWSVVLQDDAILCTDFLARSEDALANVPGPGVVSFYLGTGRVEKRVAQVLPSDEPFVQMERLFWGVAIAIPTAMVPWMLERGEDYRRQRLQYDDRIGDAFKGCWYTNPSLVDHRDSPSLLGHDVNSRGRRVRHAVNFAG